MKKIISKLEDDDIVFVYFNLINGDYITSIET